jgi:cation transport ATPase
LADPTPPPRWWQALQEAYQGARQAFTRCSKQTAVIPPTDTHPLTTAQRGKTATDDAAYGLRTATLALGVTTVGVLVAPPLRLAGLPLLVYMGIPAAQTTYEQLWMDGRPNRALVETVVLGVCLVGGYYWVGALGFWLYYGSRTLLAPTPQSTPNRSTTWQTPTTVHLWQAGTTSVVPTNTLQPGDQLLLQSGDMTPVAGVIVEGVAWVRSQAMANNAGALRKSVGSQLLATELVVVGRVCVRVQ